MQITDTSKIFLQTLGHCMLNRNLLEINAAAWLALRCFLSQIIWLSKYISLRPMMECKNGYCILVIFSSQLRSDFESTVASLVSGGVIEGSEVNIELITSDPVISGSSVDPPSTPTANRIVLLTNPLQTEVQDLEFDFNQYTRLLTTGHVGRTLLYTPVIGSTQTMLTGNLKFARSLSSELGVVCVAGQQTRGRGIQYYRK